MAAIEKKVWTDSFQKIMNSEKKAEFRLADFALNEGDTILLKEFDRKTKKLTGRMVEKKCARVQKFNPLDYYTADEMKKHGCYLIELE